MVLGFLVLTACEGTETTSALGKTDTAEGHQIQSLWTYRSFKVDVDLTLTTLEAASAECSTSARLVVNDVVSSTDTYVLPETDCSVLRLTDAGDLVFYGEASGHDWTRDRLSVDTGDEVISLGPVSSVPPGGATARTYQFTLSAPPCADDSDCDCGALRRFADSSELALDLGRICD
jgi:hypothetical protein